MCVQLYAHAQTPIVVTRLEQGQSRSYTFVIVGPTFPRDLA